MNDQKENANEIASTIMNLCLIMANDEEGNAASLLEMAISQTLIKLMKINKRHSVCITINHNHITNQWKTHTHFNYQEAEEGHFCQDFD